MRCQRAPHRWLLALIAVTSVSCARSARPDGANADDYGEGRASFYGAGFQGRKTANGERFDKEQFTAAHRTLPFGTCVEVENLDNGRRVRVRINDRGPYAGGRILDISEAAAQRLEMIDRG